MFKNYIFKTFFNDTVCISDKKVQKLSLGLYLFKRYTFVNFRC